MRNIFLLSVLFLAISVTAFAQKSKTTEILTSEVFSKNLAEEESNIVLLDVRTLEEFNTGHLKGAANYDLKSADFTKQVKKLNPEKTYYIYCKSGKRSAEAAKKMRRSGIKNVYELQGGITQWKEDGLEIVKRNNAD